MSKASDKRRFYCLPVSAIQDARLTALDHRILGVVALHDGMSGVKGGGGGCYASYKTLTDIVGCDYTNFGRSVSKLIQLGYLSRDPQILDKRKFTLRVLYPGLNSCQSDQQSSANPKILVGSPDNHLSEIVGHENFEPRSNLPETDEHYISLNEELDVAEARKETPLNGATLEKPRRLGNDGAWERRGPLTPETATSSNIGSLLSRFESDLKNGCVELDYQAWHDWLWNVSEDQFDETEGRWAARLLTEYEWPDGVEEKY